MSHRTLFVGGPAHGHLMDLPTNERTVVVLKPQELTYNDLHSGDTAVLEPTRIEYTQRDAGVVIRGHRTRVMAIAAMTDEAALDELGDAVRQAAA